MSKSNLKELLSRALRLSAITNELGQCCCANLNTQSTIITNQEGFFRLARTDSDYRCLNSGCAGGVCEVTWKPLTHAA